MLSGYVALQISFLEGIFANVNANYIIYISYHISVMSYLLPFICIAAQGWQLLPPIPPHLMLQSKYIKQKLIHTSFLACFSHISPIIHHSNSITTNDTFHNRRFELSMQNNTFISFSPAFSNNPPSIRK